jgi:hypothetical protein
MSVQIMSRHLGRAFRYRMRIPEKMRGLVIVGGGVVKEDEMNLEARFETGNNAIGFRRGALSRADPK